MQGVDHVTPAIAVLGALLLCPVIYYIRAARAGRTLFVRRIPGVDAIEQAVGGAAELGRPVSFSTGLTGVGPVLFACCGILSAVTRRVARYKTRLLVPQNQPDVLAVVESVVSDSYRAEGRGDAYDPESIRFLSEEQFAFASGYMGLVQRENVATAFLFGHFAGESLILAEAGQQIGATQVAGTTSPEQVPFFIATCDYTLIGEELFAAAAYMTREPVQMGSLRGQDVAKAIFLALILIGALVETLRALGLTGVGSPHSIMTWGL